MQLVPVLQRVLLQGRGLFYHHHVWVVHAITTKTTRIVWPFVIDLDVQVFSLLSHVMLHGQK
uniref:Uncharacterized protein n=1 Tax=Arundo donax TaxID=35708 RepID=A0A0A9HKI0_ARUDO